MTLSDLSIKRPVFTTMMAVLLVVLGLIGLSRLGTDLFPKTALPIVIIITEYRGAGPLEIESQVVQPIENAAATINGIDTITSFSRENVGITLLQFKLHVPLDEAIAEVRDKIAAIQSNLPKDAAVPRVSRIDLGATPIVTYAINADLPSTEFQQLIAERIAPAMSQIDGVASTRTLGVDKREIRIDVDSALTKAVGLAPAQIAQHIGKENLNIPAGRMDLGPAELTVRVLGEFKSLEELRNLPIIHNPKTGSHILLRELATVTDSVADKRTLVRLNGKSAIVFEVIKRPDANTVDVATRVKKKMAALSQTLGHGFNASVLIDSSTIIEETANEVWVALIFGGLMAIAIILFFLLDIRGTFISALALPTSVIGTFFAMYILDYSFNQMTLLALSLSIGLLIDDAVVVREAITHRLEMGEAPQKAAAHGTSDVFLAVLATTLSLVAVFVPVAFMPGMVGQFFKQFGITIAVAVLISMFISFTLDPMLSARLSKQRVATRAHPLVRRLRAFFAAIESLYSRALGWTLKHQWKTAAMTLLVLGVSFSAASTLGNDFMVPEDRGQYLAELKFPPGTSIAEAEARAAQAEELMRTIPDVTDAYSTIGSGVRGFTDDANMVHMRMLTKPRSQRSLNIPQLKALTREKFKALPATQVTLTDPPLVEGVGDFLPIMLYVMGPKLDVLEREAQRIRQLLESLQNDDGVLLAADVRTISSPPSPELTVSIDRTRARETGLTSVMLGGQLRMAVHGQKVGHLREGKRETAIVLRIPEANTPETMDNFDIFTPSGVRAVSDVAHVEIREAPNVIEHFDRQRRATIVASPAPGISLGELAAHLRQALQHAPPPAGYTLFYDGQLKLLDEQNAAFIFVFFLSFVFAYMVLASQFESFKHPFTIMMSVPLALAGAFLTLVMTGYSINLGAMIGIILLMGLVTKNAILLVDQALQNLRAGDALDAALMKAGPRRLRPILMTSAAIAIGMVPTALGRGQGFEFRVPMALAVIGGVVTSTLMTLLVVPLVFSTLEKMTPKSLRVGAGKS